jgi:hypothetical protein
MFSNSDLAPDNTATDPRGNGPGSCPAGPSDIGSKLSDWGSTS